MLGARSDRTPVYARRPWKAIALCIVAWSLLFSCIESVNGWADDKAIVSTIPDKQDGRDRASRALIDSSMLATPSILNPINEIGNGSSSINQTIIHAAWERALTQQQNSVLIYGEAGKSGGSIARTDAGSEAFRAGPISADMDSDIGGDLPAGVRAPSTHAIKAVSEESAALAEVPPVDIASRFESTVQPVLNSPTVQDEILDMMLGQVYQVEPLSNSKLLEFRRKGDGIYNKPHITIFGDVRFGFFAVEFVVSDRLATEYPAGVLYEDYGKLHKEGALKFYGLTNGNLQPMSGRLNRGAGLNFIELNMSEFARVVKMLDKYKAALAEDRTPALDDIGTTIYRPANKEETA